MGAVNFLNQGYYFEPLGDGFVYRSTIFSPGYSVSSEEKDRLFAELKRLDERQAELESRAAELDRDREALVTRIDAGLLARYEKIAARHGSAVARVHRETCQGCRVNIPPQMHIELLRGESLITCQRCKRILIPEK